MSLQSRTIDRTAAVVAALFALGVVIVVVVLVGSAVSGGWLAVVAEGGLAAIFGVQCYGFGRSARAGLTLTDDGATRDGPQGWTASAAEVARARVVHTRGQDHLVVPGSGMHLSALYRGLPPGSRACPLDPEVVAAVRERLSAPA